MFDYFLLLLLMSEAENKINNYISVDCVVFGYDSEKLNVLVVERTLTNDGNTPDFVPDWTLTGNHVYEDETLKEAATRVVYSLTGISNIYLEQFKTFADPGRLLKPKDQKWLKSVGKDPGQRVVSIGYFALVATQRVTLKWMGRKVKWASVQEIGALGFDHNHILQQALLALRSKMKHEPIGFELLPEKFTLTQLQTVYEQIFDTRFDKRNFRKKVSRMKYVIPLNEKQKGVPHKPAQLYMFSREVFEKTNKELFDFII